MFFNYIIVLNIFSKKLELKNYREKKSDITFEMESSTKMKAKLFDWLMELY